MQHFVLKKETTLFQYRLQQYKENAYLLKGTCKTVLKDIRKLRYYQELSPLTGMKEPPCNGTMLFTTLTCLCKLLIRDDVNHHFRLDCRAGCNEIEIESK